MFIFASQFYLASRDYVESYWWTDELKKGAVIKFAQRHSTRLERPWLRFSGKPVKRSEGSEIIHIFRVLALRRLKILWLLIIFQHCILFKAAVFSITNSTQSVLLVQYVMTTIHYFVYNEMKEYIKMTTLHDVRYDAVVWRPCLCIPKQGCPIHSEPLHEYVFLRDWFFENALKK